MGGVLARLWRYVRWPLIILVIAYIALVVWRIPGYNAEQESKATVAEIHAQKLTLADVGGSNLPPKPDSKLVDATVEGVDANENGIRDDVELAIFAKYPNSPYTRAAELQYAMTQQMYLTRVFDTGTWKAVAEENGRTLSCLLNLDLGYRGTNALTDEVESVVFNTETRKQAREAAFQFITSHGDAPGKGCDVEII